DAAILATTVPGGLRIRLGNRLVDVLWAPTDDGCTLALEGVSVNATVEDERLASLAQFGGGRSRARGSQVVLAPMPGLVVRVNVEPGRSVAEGESLIVLQAMKMENELASPRTGTVKAVRVRSGKAGDQG